ncbi:MAG: chemotaxis protein CheA [Candidatus Riflebacteria bacterium]|nr:chemotaxis protein CheA [Candidatus Riflebacteria bacterium]
MTNMVRDDEWKTLLSIFLTESLEMLDEVEPKLVELEKMSLGGSENNELLNSIFRLYHSLKGGAASLNLDVIRDLTHEAETLLDMFRSKKITITPQHIDLLCQACDFMRKLLDRTAMDFDDGALAEPAKVLRAQFIEEIKKSMPGDKKKTPAPPPAAPSPAPQSAAAQPAAPTAPAPDHAQLADNIDELKLDLTPEMIRRFTEEAEELFEEAEQSLLIIEKGAASPEVVAQAFRALHSFKGNAGFFNYTAFTHFSHEAETLLGLIRDEKLPSTPAAISALLAAIDVLKRGISRLKSEKVAVLDGDGPVVERLKAAMSEVDTRPRLGQILVDSGLITEDALQEALEAQEKVVPPVSATKAADASHPPSESGGAAGSQRAAIRVDTDKLDRLIELVGELVISVSNVTNCPDLKDLHLDRLEKAVDRLTKITKDLQSIAMSVRMIPIAGLFRKMVRPVRDLAKNIGKKIDLQFIGEDTEVDKNVIELISDPLMHMIRNAVDHGIEPAAKRKEVGKAETGNIVLEARHSGSEVWIIVRDDGRGLDRPKILAKAQEVGLITGSGDDLRDEEVFKYIFEPGFSTAAVVTEVSGRGVGMDVVKKNIEKLKGRVDIRSSVGKGSQFTTRIPLTLAIIDGMVVRVGKERYIIPTQSIIEVFRPTSENISTVTHKGEVVSIRGNFIPLFRIADLFGLLNAENDPTHANVMIVESDGRTLGFLVDEILGQQQTVIKSLGSAFGAMPGVSGAAVMPDGRVGLILDVTGIIKIAMGDKDN